MMQWIRKTGSRLRGDLLGLMTVALATLVFVQGREHFAKGQWALLYLLLIVFVASQIGVRPGIIAAVAAFFSWNFFFLPPYHTLLIHDPKDWLSLFAFLIVGLAMGLQTGRLREREALARVREHETALLNAFSGRLVSDISVDEMADVLASDLMGIVGAGCALLFIPNGDSALVRSGTGSTSEADVVRAYTLAEWAFARMTAVGLNEGSHRQEGWPASASYAEAEMDTSRTDIAIPLLTADRKLGVLYIGPKTTSAQYTRSESRLLVAIANQAAAFLERKHLHAIAVQADALREADRMKSTFVSSVSHELKTPLASTTATLTNLLESDMDWSVQSAREEIAAALDGLDRLNDSISSLVDLSRLESSVWRPNREWYELGEILGTVLSRIPERRAGRIHFAIPDDLPQLQVDCAQWARALSNLVENALDYTPQDSVVSIGAETLEDEVRFWVEDHGPGIPVEEQERIFEKFYRGSSSSRRASGTGLGLAIAREIVRSHGGRIWVENVEPTGARFVISMPLEDKE